MDLGPLILVLGYARWRKCLDKLNLSETQQTNISDAVTKMLQYHIVLFLGNLSDVGEMNGLQGVGVGQKTRAIALLYVAMRLLDNVKPQKLPT